MLKDLKWQRIINVSESRANNKKRCVFKLKRGSFYGNTEVLTSELCTEVWFVRVFYFLPRVVGSCGKHHLLFPSGTKACDRAIKTPLAGPKATF